MRENAAKIIYSFLLLIYSGLLNGQNRGIGQKISIANDDDFSGFQVLDSGVNGKQLIIAGEVSQYPGFNSKLEFKLLKYLNQKQHVRNYLLEIGQAKAYLVNQYINTTDTGVERLLKSVTTLKYMKLYKSLRKLNKSLPDSMKIRVFGVDKEMYSGLPLVRVAQLMPEDSIPDELRIPVEALEGAAKFIISKGLESYEREKKGIADYDYFYNPSTFSVRESLDEFLKVYDSLVPQFKEWLGPKFNEVQEAVGWMKENKEWQKYSYSAMQFGLREEHIFNRINDLIKAMPGEKFFGQFELCRVSYSVLPKGCDFYDFSGVVNKLVHNPASQCKSLVNIGIFYKQILDGSDYSWDKDNAEAVHGMFSDTLLKWFDSVPSKSAAFVKFSNNKNADSALSANYSIALLNNEYPVEEDAGSADSVESETGNVSSKDDNSWYGSYEKARIYLGAEGFMPFVKLDKINEALVSSGFNKIGSLASAGVSISGASADNTMFHLYYGEGRIGNQYRNYRIQCDFGGNFLYTKHVKWSFLYGIGYTKHRLQLSPGNTNQTFFTDYKSPVVLTNPALITGFSSMFVVEMGPFYIFANGGRQWDEGDKRWKLNGKYTGSDGNLSNTAWYVSVGVGFAIHQEAVE